MTTRLNSREAYNMLRDICGDQYGRDFNDLTFHVVGELHDRGKLLGYRQPRNAPGSYARSFYAYLCRIETRGV